VDYNADTQVKGRKIHALVDSEGLPMRVVVHSAVIQDRDGAGLVLDKIRRRFPWLELIWADGDYNVWQVEAAVAKVPLLRMEIVKRSDDVKVCKRIVKGPSPERTATTGLRRLPPFAAAADKESVRTHCRPSSPRQRMVELGRKGAFGYGRGAADMNLHFPDEAAGSRVGDGHPGGLVAMQRCKAGNPMIWPPTGMPRWHFCCAPP
jgi:Transposase DDE domain